MSKIILNNVGSLIDATPAANTINANNAVITTAMDNTLSRDGTSPNQMNDTLDMNSNQIVNLPNPATAFSPLRLQDLSTFIGAGTITNIPAGGTIGQVFAKNSNANYDVGWKNSVTSVGLVLPADLTVTNSPVTTTGTLTGAWATTPTGTGAMVRATSPTLVTPVLGIATATTINKVTFTAPATNATITIPEGITLTGPAASGTIMTLGNNETVTGVKTFGAAGNVGKLVVAGTTSGTTIVNATAVASGTLILPAATDTLIGKATIDTLTNKTFDTAGTGNSFSINGVTVTGNTGTGSVVRAISPTFTGAPILAAPSATTLSVGTTGLSGYIFRVVGSNGTSVLVDNDGTQFTELDYANNGTVKATTFWDNTATNFNFRNLVSGGAINFGNHNGTSIATALSILGSGVLNVAARTATPAGGAAAAAMTMGTTAGFGIYYGSGVPTVSAAAGSLYIRTDNAGANLRLYSNTTGSTTWAAITSA